jgi:hypothetical protein
MSVRRCADSRDVEERQERQVAATHIVSQSIHFALERVDALADVRMVRYS